MKTLIIYTSQTGFTKRYAEWLAKKLSGYLLDLNVQMAEKSAGKRISGLPSSNGDLLSIH